MHTMANDDELRKGKLSSAPHRKVKLGDGDDPPS